MQKGAGHQPSYPLLIAVQQDGRPSVSAVVPLRRRWDEAQRFVPEGLRRRHSLGRLASLIYLAGSSDPALFCAAAAQMLVLARHPRVKLSLRSRGEKMLLGKIAS